MLPEGDSSDTPERETVRGLGNRKDAYFLTHIREHGVTAYGSTVELVQRLADAGFATASISASRNMLEVLAAAGLADLFEVKVDGRDADVLGIPGKPDPAVFVEAARRLGAEPPRSAVVEDALAGVEAGRRGGFGLVVGVDRVGQSEALRAAGADVVVEDLSELRIEGAAGEAGSPAERVRRGAEAVSPVTRYADALPPSQRGSRPGGGATGGG